MRNDFSIFFPHIQWITKVAAGSRPSFLMAFTASYKIQASNTVVSVKILATITAWDNMFWESRGRTEERSRRELYVAREKFGR